MSKIKIYCLALCGLLLAACSGGDTEDIDGGKTKSTPVTVKLSLSTSATGTRANKATWSDPVEGENMKNWFVVITDENYKIVKIVSSNITSGEKEVDDLGTITLDSEGDYYFYSFANMTQTEVLGSGVGEGSTLPDGLKNNTATYPVAGNCVTLPSTGIPMSNRQKINITSSGYSYYDGTTKGTETSGHNIDLWVVRMMAKIELQITNGMSSDLTINSVTISDITPDGTSDANNLYLLPDPLDGANKVECVPHLAKTAGTPADYTATPTSTLTIKANTEYKANTSTNKFTFYVNESKEPTNNFKQFILTLNTSQENTASDAETNSTTTSMRYALISKTVSGDNTSWDGQIARNDYHIIPVTLDDYEFRLDIYQSEAIGVLPYWVYSDGIYTCTFYNGEEHFHIAPLIKRISDGETLKYGTGAGTWTVDESESTEGLPPCWQVVGTENTSIFDYANTTATHGSDNGGCPRWSSADHFAFGKFAAQETTGKSTYKMTVTVNRDGTNPTPAQRTYTYQLCIVRDNLSTTSSGNGGVKRQSVTSNSLFGYGRLLKAE